MNKEILKQMWFNLPTRKVLKKCIIVETNYGHVEILSDGPNGYSSFKTNQGENALQYALNRKEYKSGEYQLVIK
jgi:hypothetical protein